MKHKGIDYKTSAVQYYLNNNTFKLSDFFAETIITQIINDALNLHKNLPNYVISVGWDVMIENNNNYF